MASSDKIGEPHPESPSAAKEAPGAPGVDSGGSGSHSSAVQSSDQHGGSGSSGGTARSTDARASPEAKLAALEASKKDAIAREDFAEAQRIKSEMEALKSEADVTKLKELEQQKKDAVFREDFDEAQRIKNQIEALRAKAKSVTQAPKKKDEIGVVHPETTKRPAAAPSSASSSTALPKRPVLDRVKGNAAAAGATSDAAPTPSPAPRSHELGKAGRPAAWSFSSGVGYTGGVSTTGPALGALQAEDRGFSFLGSSGVGLLLCILASVMFAGYRRLKGHMARSGYTNVRDKGWQDVETVDQEFGLDGTSQVRRPPARAFTSGAPTARVVGIANSNGQEDVLSSNIAFGEEESLDDFFTAGGGTFGENKTLAPAPKAVAQPIASGLDDLFGNLPQPGTASTDVRIVGGELKF